MVGASVKVLLKFLHPSELVRNKYLNLQSGQWLEGCTTIRQEVKCINRHDQLSLVVTHNDFHDDEGNLHELHAVKHYFTVGEEGDPDLFFDAATLGQEPEGQQVLLQPVINADMNGVNHGGANELITALTGVVEIDDNNEPAPKNIPVPESARTSPILHSSWGHSGFCFHKQEGLPNKTLQSCQYNKKRHQSPTLRASLPPAICRRCHHCRDEQEAETSLLIW